MMFAYCHCLLAKKKKFLNHKVETKDKIDWIYVLFYDFYEMG